MVSDFRRLNECCVVPVRMTSLGAEFCLLTPLAENRWEFPKLRLEDPAVCDMEFLRLAAANAGLRGHLPQTEALGQFVASRANEIRSMTGFLMQVEQVEDFWPQQDSHRRLWCLAEEARIRIRRKPLRRFIDLALHCLQRDPLRLPSTNGS